MSGVRHAARQHSVPYEGSSNWRYPSGSGGGYYYSSRGGNSATPSPSSNVSYRSNHHHNSSIGPMDSSNTIASHRRTARADHQESPTYHVEHLATFAVGREFGLQYPNDGVRKLKQMEKNSAIWAQPMLLRLKPQMISVEDENGDPVEQFPMDLVRDPTAHISDDPQDVYNNILLFVVREDQRGGQRSVNPTEMHIFQCLRVSAREVVEDIEHYIHGEYTKVRPGKRDYSVPAYSNGAQFYQMNQSQVPPQQNGFHQQRGSFDAMVAPAPNTTGQFRDNASASSDTSEYFERDVNTLNRCFDDIERFVARIQSAAIAQRELEAQAHRFRSQHRNKQKQQHQEMQHGILQLRAQLPQAAEFHEILQKFKLSFNLLAKLKNHIHEPNAPELLHYLFTPLIVILDACHWGLGRNIADQVVSPLITLEARELMQNCLNSKEADVWMSLGNAWRIPPEDWVGPLPPPYRPVFVDGFAPYGNPNVSEMPPVMKPVGGRRHPSRTDSEPPPINQYAPQRAARSQSLQPAMFELDRLFHEEQHKLQMEKDRIREQERLLNEERMRFEDEKNRMLASRQTYSSTPQLNTSDRDRGRYADPISPVIPQQVDSPRVQSFLDRLRERRAKVVQATYDRTAQNPKELTVSRGEYLEVLNDTKNWWECRNIHNRSGFVPHTILSLIPHSKELQIQGPQQSDIAINPPQHMPGSSISPRPERALPPHQRYRQTQPNPLGSVDLDNIVPIANQLREERNNNIILKKPNPSPKLSPTSSLPLEKMLLDEFVNTLKRNGPKPKPKAAPKWKINLTADSSKEVVQEWLKEKEFSPQLQKLFSEMNGENLFHFDKAKLVEHCGEEGSRLYSLLLVQKKNSNYNTGKPAELHAILKQRRQKVDAQNEAADEEPEQEAPSLASPGTEDIPATA